MRLRVPEVLLGAVVLALAAAGGCGGESTAAGSRPTVVAGFYPLAYAAETIGGGDLDVVNLTPPGSEPHDVELSVRDVERVRSADHVLYLGSGFQPGLEEAAAGARDGAAVDLLAGVELRRDGDPHVWLDPVRYAAMVGRIGDALDRRPAAEELAAEVRALDAEYRDGLRTCERHAIVTSHEAFGYLADRYGLEQIAISGLSPEVEPTPRQLERVVEAVRRSGATTVFSEQLVSPRLAETVARETGASNAVLDPLESISEEDASSGADYPSVMRSNLAVLRRALGCT